MPKQQPWVSDLPPEMANDPNMVMVNKMAKGFERVALETLGVDDYTKITPQQGKQIMGALTVALFNGAPLLKVSANMLVELIAGCMNHLIEEVESKCNEPDKNWH